MNARAAVISRVAQARQAREQEVDLELRPVSAGGSRRARAGGPARPARRSPASSGRRPTTRLRLPVWKRTSPSPIAVTSTPVRTCAPAATAASRSAAVSAPMPPIGTSQSPVPPPMAWYRKQRFWRRPGSSSGANVPISPSVSTTPRTRSSASAACTVTRQRRLHERLPGRVVADDAPQLRARAQRLEQRREHGARDASRPWRESAATRRTARRRRSPPRTRPASPGRRRPATSSPRAPCARGSGVYEETARRTKRTGSASSSTMRRGSRLTRYA